MKNKRPFQCHAASNRFDKHVRAAQLTNLRATLARAKSRPPNGELMMALEKMLDAGQIECEPARQGSTGIVIGARVTPDEIKELLPLVRHPNAQALLRCFVERYITIPRLKGTEDNLPFQGMPGAEFDRFPSGVPDPPELGELAIQWAAEEEVVAYLGVPFRLTIDGWTDLHVAGRSVEIRWVREEETSLSYPTIEDFRKEIVIVALPTSPDEPISILEWVDREQFLRLQRSLDVGGDTRACVFDLANLFPMAVLKDAARQKAFPMR